MNRNRFWVDKEKFYEMVTREKIKKTEFGYQVNKTFIKILRKIEQRIQLEIDGLAGPMPSNTDDVIDRLKKDCGI